MSQPHGFGHVFMMTPVLAFALGIYPVVTTYADYVFLFLAFMAATELLLLALAGDLPYESVWRSRQMWVGLTPIYIWAAILALAYGPKRKPVYRVTRKTHQVGLYWQEVLPQIRLFLALTGSILSPTLALTVAGPSSASATPSPPRRSPRWPSRPLLGTGGMSSGRAHRPAVRPRTEHRARRPLWYPWQGDPEGYRAAFRRIVTIFREEGATNVQFLWSAMWLDAWADLYYPGDDVVDWVGTTALNHGTGATAEWARWRSFYELFDGQYQAALKWGKPIMLTEVATAEQGGNKAEWIRECFRLLKEKYQMVRVIVLLEVTSDREWPVINWSVASSPESLAAFLEAIQDPYVR